MAPTPIRKEVVFNPETEQELSDFVTSLGRGFSPLVKRLLREHIAHKKYGVDYALMRQIMEEVLDAKNVSIKEEIQEEIRRDNEEYETDADNAVFKIFGGMEL